MAKCSCMKKHGKHHGKKPCCKKLGSLIVPGLTFFMGTTIGFLISPIKGGMGNNNGNTTNNYYGNVQLKDPKKRKERKEKKKKEASK